MQLSCISARRPGGVISPNVGTACNCKLLTVRLTVNTPFLRTTNISHTTRVSVLYNRYLGPNVLFRFLACVQQCESCTGYHIITTFPVRIEKGTTYAVHHNWVTYHASKTIRVLPPPPSAVQLSTA